jgi:hypothetical protein
MWPLNMGPDWGKWRRTRADVRSGKVVKRPASRAAHRVDKTGENREAWRKAMRWCIFVVGKAALAVKTGGMGGAVGVGVEEGVSGMSKVQRRVDGQRGPYRMVLP